MSSNHKHVNMHPITVGKEDPITGTLKNTKRKEIYQYGANTETEDQGNYRLLH
jgi:hypothetical protein